MASLQWRAGQLPGQTPSGATTPTTPTTSFNGGPGNCPAKLGELRPVGSGCETAFNGGPGNCPAKRALRKGTFFAAVPLQWRAGQLPGQTINASRWPQTRALTLQWRAGQLPGQTPEVAETPHPLQHPSMEGRAIARPNSIGSRAGSTAGMRLQWRAGQLPGQTTRDPVSHRRWRSTFNGGPGNCPAKPGHDGRSPCGVSSLQWRAGQLPGQTQGCGHRTTVTLQWRAGPSGATLPTLETFNGGPGNCPAKRADDPIRRSLRRRVPFNGGPGNCPAKRAGRSLGHGAVTSQPSMEGRAIARPNPVDPSDSPSD